MGAHPTGDSWLFPATDPPPVPPGRVTLGMFLDLLGQGLPWL